MKTIAQQLGIKDFPFEIKDKNGNRIYYEDSDGHSVRHEYDSDGNEVCYQTSKGYSIKQEYDSDGNRRYYEDSHGNIVDNRPKESTKRCHCGAKFDGIECYACGFDATEIDIY